VSLARREGPGAAPKAPYTIKPNDLLYIAVAGMPPDEVIDGVYAVEPPGTVVIGPSFGRVNVEGFSLEAAEKAIQKKLKEFVKDPEVSVTVAGWMNDATGLVPFSIQPEAKRKHGTRPRSAPGTFSLPQVNAQATVPAPAGRTVTGRVLTEPGGKGVAGAIVCLMRDLDAASYATARTDEDGTYTFHNVVPGERYKTWIEAAPGRPAGVWSENDEFDVLQHDVKAYDHLFLKHPQSITGTVRDAETGQPVAGAWINFSMPDGKRRRIATDAQGRYRLYVHSRTVALRCDGSDTYDADSSSEQRVTPEANRETMLDFRCAKGAQFSGRVVNPDGTPAKNVCVRLLVQWPGRADGKKEGAFDSSFATGFEIDTDDDGEFTGCISRPFGRDPNAAVYIGAHAWPPDGSMYGSAQSTTPGLPAAPLVVHLSQKEAPEDLLRQPIVWSGPRDGIEYGLKILGPNRRRIGEHVRFSVYARNPGDSIAGIFGVRDGSVTGEVKENAIQLRLGPAFFIGNPSVLQSDIHLTSKEQVHLGTGRFLLVPPDIAGDAKGEAISRAQPLKTTPNGFDTARAARGEAVLLVKPGKFPVYFATDLVSKPVEWDIALNVEAASDDQLRELRKTYSPAKRP
jgi:hypothetical protein